MTPRNCLAIAASGLLLLASGCAGWKQNLAALMAMPERKERASEVMRSFEQHRDTAQLQAALDRWHQGDTTGCEVRLAALVQRRPDFFDARLRLGEVLASRGESGQAEAHFRAVLERQPDRAEAHHAVGLLLDAVGKADEARQHLARAAELEPENEVYQETWASLAPSTKG